MLQLSAKVTSLLTSLAFQFLLLLLINHDTLAYVPNLDLMSRRYRESANPEEEFLKDAVIHRRSNQSNTNTEFNAHSQTKYFNKNNAVYESSSKEKIGMLVRITPRMINYLAKELKLMFQTELENEQLPDFSRILMKLNVSVLGPRIHNVTIPRFNYKVNSNSTVEVLLRGGSARFLSSYRAVYRTVREGHLEANMSSFSIALKFRITTTFAGKLLLEDIVCGAEVRSVDVRLTPKLHELVDEGLRVELDETTSIVICESLETQMSKFEERLNKLIRSPLIDLQIHNTLEPLLIDTTISNGILLTEEYFDFPLLGTPAVNKLEHGMHPLKKLQNDTSKMVYVYISEFVLNTLLKQLDTFGETVLQLNADPEFEKMLSLNCTESVECMGDFFQDTELFQPNSGRMIIRTRAPPIASIRDGFALIDLHLTCTITYMQENVDVKVLGFEWLITVRVTDQFLNRLLGGEWQNVLNTISMVHLVESAVSNVTPHVEMITNFDEHLLRLIAQRSKNLERLLSEECALIRLSPSSLYKAISPTGAFRNRTVMVATDLEWTPELLHQFSLSD